MVSEIQFKELRYWELQVNESNSINVPFSVRKKNGPTRYLDFWHNACTSVGQV